ncbi:hypothetical protein Nepgr_019502 [Nepenthes gracilis]|uniref:Peroxidase n=1 Tax=Nepenthes gracilis TaxID=150966 RepID=A0AAD3SX83_NEPGR|nr:hypothetical protein Nepgr_019502 [Nepenthes gracilis]
MEITRKLSFLLLVLCVSIFLKNQNAETNNGPSNSSSIFSAPSNSQSSRNILSSDDDMPRSLEYDYYRESCPKAEQIIRMAVRNQHKFRPNIAPAFLRLIFHDCFIEGCDASVLLDAIGGGGSEKEVPPNETLKGFDVVDFIKSEVEEACPGVVSCADILALAAREAVSLAGGPYYPLLTGRRDSLLPFPELAAYEIPNPQDDLSTIIASFASRGFDEQEAVTLLGAHSVGMIHCKFFANRLYNFHNTEQPDPSVDAEFLNFMRTICNNSNPSLSTSPPLSSPMPSRSSPSSQSSRGMMKMDYEGPGTDFGTLYYRSLLRNRGILFADQQLTSGENTKVWVTAYATNPLLFRKEFAMVMMKLSNLSVLTAPMGQVRLHCAKVA